jgi:probable phosphoglycerate mutase
MRLLIIRHGDPDYSIDSLTEKGWREAEYLSDRISKLNVKQFYVSPLGRAKDTAAVTLKKMNRTAIELPWLREFKAPIIYPATQMEKSSTWDWLPKDWTVREEFYDKNLWHTVSCMEEGNVYAQAKWVYDGLDEILKVHGYVRKDNVYEVVNANSDTIVLFCHFGVECVMLSHLLGISPMPLWHGLCAAPTSVSTLLTEERQEGIASFRMSSFGDVSHLYVAGEEPAFAARFCEKYENADERH